MSLYNTVYNHDIYWEQDDDTLLGTSILIIDDHECTFSAEFTQGSLEISFAVDGTIKQQQTNARFALRVLGASAYFLSQAMADCDADHIKFSADLTEKSRVKLYERLARTLADDQEWFLSMHTENSQRIFEVSASI